MTTSQLSCPACEKNLSRDSFTLIEKHHDTIADKDYELIRCPGCRVIFAEPRTPVGADWYGRAFARGIIERAPVVMTSWRIQNFRSHGLGGELLDVGCGDGGFLKVARELGCKVRGFDFDPRAVEKARALGLDAWTSDFESAFADPKLRGQFDVVTLFDVLEHVPEPAAFLARAKRLVKAGGHMAFTMPDDRAPHPGEREKLDYPPNHFTRWRADSIRAFLERQGLRVVLITSAPITARYLAGQVFFGCLMPKFLPWVKRLIFARRGKGADSGRSISEQFEHAQADSGASGGGRLADKSFRMRLVDAAFWTLYVLLLPVTLPAALWYRLNGYGHTLYVLAQVPKP